jgi:uncharacterized protein YjiS (DUF1127 family)
MLISIISTVELWWHTHRACRETEALDVEMLDDIGLAYDKMPQRKIWL